MSSLGIRLRELREAKGVSLDDIARSTRVGRRHLEALETDSWAELPAPVFVKGFIRAYCDFLDASPDEALERDGWIVRRDVTRDYHLKIVSLETMTACNQKCYFCPVSIAPRADYTMPTEFFEQVVNQLTDYRGTIESVFLQSYNEPTLDRRFVETGGTVRDFLSEGGQARTVSAVDAEAVGGAEVLLLQRFASASRAALAAQSVRAVHWSWHRQ